MRSLYIILQLLFLSGVAIANPSGINLSGKISIQATNSALSATDVDFKVRVLSPDGCILYSEKFTNVDLSATAGVFNLTIGNGQALFNAWDATLGTANSKASLLKVFSNGSTAIPSGLATYPGENCAGGAYTPADGDVRKVVIEFDPTGQDINGNYVALSPFHRIRSVPYAMLADHATDSDKLGGVAANLYAKTADIPAAVAAAEADPTVEAWSKTPITGLTGGNCGAGKVLTFNGTSLECVTDGGGGGGGSLATNTVAGTVLVDAGSNISLNLGTGALDLKDIAISKVTGLQTALDGKIGFANMPDPGCAADEALNWSSLTDTFTCYPVVVDAADVTGLDAAVDARIAADTTKLPVAGGTMTGNINMGNNQLSNVGYVHLQNKAADPGGLVAGNEGFVWYNSTDKQIKYYNGTAINALPAYTGACADGQILKWNNTTKVWACAADAGASGGANATQLQGVDIAAAPPSNGQFLKYTGVEWTPTSMPTCTADQVMIFNGTGVATCTAISGLTNSAIAIGAAIDRTKIAGGTINHVLINDGTGALSSEAQLAISRGGTGLGTAPAADQVLVGNGTAYDLKTLTAGTGITINTAGSAVTIAATATAPADSAYDTKGVVGFQTDAATSGMVYSSAGIARVNTGTGADQIVKLDNTGKLPAIDGSALTNVNDSTKLPLAGGTMSGNIAMGAHNITNTGDITMAASKAFGLSAFAADPGSPIVGQVWYNSTDKVIRYYDGAVKTLGVSGAGLQSLNGESGSTQTFATSTAGASLGFTSASDVHTLNIPIATASRDGLLSQTDYATFNGKLDAVSNVAALADTKVWVGDGTGKAQERTLSGAFTIDNTGVATLSTVDIAHGGTGQTSKTAAFNALSPATTKGDITVHNGTNVVRLAVGADGKALVADSAAAEGVKWGDIFATDLANITGLGIVQKTGAGTYVTLGTAAPLAVVGTDITLNPISNANIDAAAAIARTKLASGTADHVLINNGSGVMSSEAQLAISRGGTGLGTAPAADQVLVGNGTGYDLKTLTAGTGVTISTAGSAVTINATATAPGDAGYTASNKGVVAFAVDAATSGINVTSGVASVNTGTGADQIVKLDNTGKLPAVDGSALTNVNDTTKLPLAGGTMAGNIAMGAHNITNTGDITMAASKVFGLSAFAADPGSPVVGQVWYNSTDKVIRYYDGAVKTLGVSGAGLQSLNGETGGTQTFATSTAGGTLGFTSAAGVHTLNIPVSDATHTGLLSSADHTAFSAKLDAVSNTAALADGKVWIGDGTGKAQERTLSGAFTIDNTGAATLATVGIAQGGTGQTSKTAAFNALSPATTKGDIAVHNGTNVVRLAVGADGKSLVADSATAEGVKWGDVVATDLANITGLGIVQKTGAGTYVTLGTAAPLAVVGTDITLNPISNANIDAAAAIARTKLANGTANRVVINTTGGVMSEAAAITANHALISDANGIPTHSTVTSAELAYLSGVTSAVQTQLDAKVAKAGDTMTGNLVMSNEKEVRFGDSGSKYIGLKSPASITGSSLTFTLPNGDGTSNQVLQTNGSGILSWASLPAGAATSNYDVQGVVGFQTDAATSGMVYSSSGIARVNTGTGANQIVKLPTAGTLPALNGSALTNLDVGAITSSSGKWLSYKPDGTECNDGEILKWVAATDRWVCGTAADLGAITSVVAGTGLDVNTVSGAATVSVEAELGALNALATTGYVQRTGAATYSTTAGNTLGSNNTVVTRDGSGVSGFYGVGVQGATSGTATIQAPGTFTNYTLTLPTTDGASGEVLSTDGSGVLSWINPTAGAGDFKADGTVPMTGALRNIAGTAALPGMTFVGDTNTGISAATADTMIMSTSGTQRMIFDPNGNVGIGTVAPTALFDVQGGTAAAGIKGKDIKIVAQTGGSGGAAGGDIYLTPGNGGGGWQPGKVFIDTSGSTNVAFQVTRAGSDGYTGSSGTNNGPSTNSLLYNSWNVDNNTALLGFSVNNGNARNQAAYVGAVSVTGASSYVPAMVFGTSSGSAAYTERMRIDTSGNLGVGTMNPGAKLDVKGAIRMSGATSGYTGFQPAAAAGSTVWTLPTTDGGANEVLKTDGAGNLGWVALPGASGDASYAAKGVVQFDTSATVSGITIASGVAKVNAGTGIGQVLQFSSAATLPALDGSALTALNATNISSGTLAVARGGTGQTTYTDGQLLIGNSTGNTLTKATLTAGTGISITNGNGSISIARSAITAGDISSGTLGVANGGTGAASFTANGLVIAGATSTSALASITCAATGRMLEWTGTTWGCSADFLSSGSPGSKVNYVLMTGGATGTGATVAAAGTDANVSLLLSAKGSGQIQTNSVLNVNGTYVERAPASASLTANATTLSVASNILKVPLGASVTGTALPACPTTAADQTFSLTVKVTNGGAYTLGWNSSNITWDSGTVPDASSGAGNVSIYQFLCFHGESTWYGMQVFKQ